MIVTPATYDECKSCGSRKLIKDSVLACDLCERPIADQDRARFDVTVHLHNSSAQHYYFDSVACAVQWLQKWTAPRDFYFISLPLLHSAMQVKYFIRQPEQEPRPKRKR